MKILALEVEMPGLTSADFQPHLKAEASQVWKLYLQGALRELYFRSDRYTAVLVLECADLTAASRLLATLPLVKENLIAFDLIPLAPYPGFARLFAEDEN